MMTLKLGCDDFTCYIQFNVMKLNNGLKFDIHKKSWKIVYENGAGKKTKFMNIF